MVPVCVVYSALLHRGGALDLRCPMDLLSVKTLVCEMRAANSERFCENAQRSPFHVLLCFPCVLYIKLFARRSTRCVPGAEELTFIDGFVLN